MRLKSTLAFVLAGSMAIGCSGHNYEKTARGIVITLKQQNPTDVRKVRLEVMGEKLIHDYSRYFDRWYERDLTDLVLRDRNHPSIFMWSIGNEVLEQWTDVRADTLSLEEANLILNFGHSADKLAKEGEMSVNSLLCGKLADMVKSFDPGRPVTAGCNEPNPDNHLFRSGALDIIGFNYHADIVRGIKNDIANECILRPFRKTGCSSNR